MSREPDLFISTDKQDGDAVEFLNKTFYDAVISRVADIHFMAQNNKCIVRFRTPGGEMALYKKTDAHVAMYIDDKIRSRAKLAMNEKKKALDGRMTLVVDGRNIDVRVSMTPSVGCGYLCVCRLLDQGNSNRSLSDIKMSKAVYDCFSMIKNERRGLFIITGPTGSGKTTTLYSLLNDLNDGKSNIITIEDPVEYRVEGIHQINVDDSITFALGLRAVLRQDPDVILVGEIRDAETAFIALEAAITGHLVLTTMHAGTADEAITRLIELGVSPHTLAAALKGVSAQRLLKKISPACEGSVVERRQPDEFQKSWLAMSGIVPSPNGYPVFTEQSKLSGVVPVMELMIADTRVKKALLLGQNDILNAAALQFQYETLSEAGERMASEGLTTLDEVMRNVTLMDIRKPFARRLTKILIQWNEITREQAFDLSESLVDLRRKGIYKRIGAHIVDSGLCSAETVVRALGYTYGASDIVADIAMSENSKNKVKEIADSWIAGESSFFDELIHEGIFSESEIAAHIFK